MWTCFDSVTNKDPGSCSCEFGFWLCFCETLITCLGHLCVMEFRLDLCSKCFPWPVSVLWILTGCCVFIELVIVLLWLPELSDIHRSYTGLFSWTPASTFHRPPHLCSALSTGSAPSCPITCKNLSCHIQFICSLCYLPISPEISPYFLEWGLPPPSEQVGELQFLY